MKIKSKLTLIGSIAALTASPLALADKCAPANADVPEISEVEPEVTICEQEPGDGEIVDEVTEETPDKEVVSEETEGGVDPTIFEMTAGGEVDPAVREVADGETVPIDWVKRGGGDEGVLSPDVIFQNSVGEAPVFKGETTAAGKELGQNELGQNEKASDIEAQSGPQISQVKREKKAPVALIKKGRVFLR